MISKIILMFMCLTASATLALDWCDPELCPNGEKHTACGNNGAFHKRCGSDVKVIDLRPYRQLILDEHNKRRNFIALGLLPGYYPAERMATLQWDDELQFVADLNARTCIVDHDDCRNTYRFRNAGQNLVGIARHKGDVQNITEILLEDIWLWYTEFKVIDSSYITKFRTTRNFEKYGHFAQFVLDRNTHVGCSMVRFTHAEYKFLYKYHLSCNYASVYALEVPVYAAGKPASGCQTGPNPKYPGLCSTKEAFNPNF
ncbi:antigen 5 like allergen Cul n 1-like [Musca domestica]|uniref:Venom allergen-1 n=2 Tax=Musca domestica TaxID=7370 RepID=A0A9J7CZ65_MUSDO|nr:antigen 5 like allergen Cul n 1-like [Musca domestica]